MTSVITDTTVVANASGEDDPYADFSPNNMMKVGDLEPLTAEEQAEVERLLQVN